MLKNLRSLFSPSIEQITEAELKRIASEFFISRTGVEMIDSRKENPLPGSLPPIFEVYGKNRKSPEDFNELDEQTINLRDESKSIKDYREKAAKIHYANCTMLACFMCDVLIKKNFNAKIFGLGSEHHFVIAKTEEPYKLLIIDPWAGKQFKITLKEDVSDLDKLSVSSRLAICEAHFQGTNLYPKEEYKQQFEAINEEEMNPNMKDDLLKQAYSISTIERFFEPIPENQTLNKPPANDAVFENKTRKPGT